jgi:hypothetical protein
MGVEICRRQYGQFPGTRRARPDKFGVFARAKGVGGKIRTAAVMPYSSGMSPLRARVEKGRLVLDEPTTLPDGTVVDLVADDEGDDLSDEERRALHEALSAWKSAEAGRLRPASAILDELRHRR